VGAIAAQVLNPEPRGARPAWPWYAALALAAGLYAAARLRGLTASCLWFDEIFSVHAARHTWGGLWSFVAADLIHPPLFYALLKLWIALGGESLLWLRLLPALTSIAALVPFFLLARELTLTRAETTLALLLLGSNGYLIKYAQEVRMYSLLLLLTLASLWLFARLLKADGAARKALLALFFVNLLLVYTHYYGWLVVACEAAFVLLARRARLRPFLLSAAALAACFGPWVWACARAAGEGGGLAQNIGWIERPRASDAAQFFALLHEPFYFRQSSNEPLFARGGALLGLLLVGLPVLLLLTRTLWRGRGEQGERPAALESPTAFESSAALRLLFFFFLLPLALAFAASQLLPHSVWGTRHLIVVAAPYLMLAGVALGRLRPFWLRIVVLVVLGSWFALVGAATLMRREPAYIWCAWETLAASASKVETGTAGAATDADRWTNDSAAADVEPVNVYAFEDLVAYHLWFAFAAHGHGSFHVSVVKGVRGLAEDPAYFLPRRFGDITVADAEAFTRERFWVAFRAPAWDERRPPLNTIIERGYRPAQVFETGAQGQRAFLVLFSR
jgi:4-amino-4-deoxy-L-arabinose transferase-like glycosyltransferase